MTEHLEYCVTADLMQIIVSETSAYAQQKIAAGLPKPGTKYDNHWWPIMIVFTRAVPKAVQFAEALMDKNVRVCGTVFELWSWLKNQKS
jgi:hypothetical protein